MSDVYFYRLHPATSRLQGLRQLLEESGILSSIENGDLVAIKLHVGEIGNPYHVDPLLVRTVVDAVKESGGDPFLTDTTTYYLYERHNALQHHRTALAHGFGYEAVRAPFIVADGLGSSDGVRLPGLGIMPEAHIAALFLECDFLFFISHCKGHPLTGYGGAVKNVGMGCATKRTKLAEHRSANYMIDTEKCTGCGTCVEVCPYGYPRVVDGKARNESELCMCCPICRDSCPAGAIDLANLLNLQKAIAACCAIFLSAFGERRAFLNVATNISRQCDCFEAPGEIVHQDIGYFASLDPVAADRAFLDAVNPSLFHRLHNVDPRVQLEEAERLGIGENRVRLIEVR